MTNIALVERDLRAALVNVREHGAGLVPRIIAPGFLNVLRKEIQNCGLFEAIEEKGPVVWQKFERFAFLYKPEGLPWLGILQKETERLIRNQAHLVLGLAGWRAVDIVVQKYGPHDHLSAHRDLSRHPYLIASYTVSGSSEFDTFGERREGPRVLCLRPEPGDLVLLRGPRFLGPGTDGRPFHRVTGSLKKGEPRIAVTFRDNTEPYTPIPHFSYRNYP